ncbi:MAG TPA: 3-deoxy-7-phosphoheptulonate synthase [Oligoflexia bacterium]|nr:3-deoxy-7-phosphoheptulonate synthase [Oligoflexia bacterium]HMP49265.1 3-deoxy-7-phosphoheptulonate synthase [Oligoflexia bacterium]
MSTSLLAQKSEINDILTDKNVQGYEALPTPKELKEQILVSEKSMRLVTGTRSKIANILAGRDKRILVIVGPCSIHDTEAGLEYASRLKELASELEDTFLILMRVYFTKPRTTTGWKGLINDPYLNNSFEIREGLYKARSFLREVVELGVPAATEALDAIVPQYIDDLISWHAIGARTAESQTHRELASGLSTPVGIKNGTDGNIQVALHAMESAASMHHFLGIDQNGRSSVITTKGNPHTHIVLRGGRTPNYDKHSIDQVVSMLKTSGLCERVLVDCSHGNSAKDHRLQEPAWRECINQIKEGGQEIFGLMLESNLNEGKQNADTTRILSYGVSITDACLGWDDTKRLLLEGRSILKEANL